MPEYKVCCRCGREGHLAHACKLPIAPPPGKAP